MKLREFRVGNCFRVAADYRRKQAASVKKASCTTKPRRFSVLLSRWVGLGSRHGRFSHLARGSWLVFPRDIRHDERS